MARRSGAAGRARIEVLSEAGLGDGEIAERLGRSRATIWRERKRCGPGHRVCAETIYRACYANCGRSGLAAGAWAELPRSQRRRKPRGRCEQARRSALGDYRPIADRPAEADDRQEPG